MINIDLNQNKLFDKYYFYCEVHLLYSVSISAIAEVIQNLYRYGSLQATLVNKFILNIHTICVCVLPTLPLSPYLTVDMKGSESVIE